MSAPLPGAAMDKRDGLAGIRGMAFMDGRWVPLAAACVPILDRGFGRSDATHDVAHVWRGRSFRLIDHGARVQAAIGGLGLSLPIRRADGRGPSPCASTTSPGAGTRTTPSQPRALPGLRLRPPRRSTASQS